MKYGYAQVSTDGQSITAQVVQLIKAACKKAFRETVSGANTDRIELREVLVDLAAGDVLVVTRLDRLARSVRDLPNTLSPISDRKVGFRSLGDVWADTTNPHGRLLLTVLGGLAEYLSAPARPKATPGLWRAGAKRAGKPCARSRGATTYTTARFPDS